VDLLRAGRLTTAELVTTYPFANIGQAFQDLAEGKEGLLKAALVLSLRDGLVVSAARRPATIGKVPRTGRLRRASNRSVR
jgi:hypothetical protein